MNDQDHVISFKEAIELGKYEPEYLCRYDEWQKIDRHVQFQFITQALTNRRRQLRLQWAGLNNQLDFSKKPYLKDALKKVEQAMKDLNADEERLFVEFAGS